MRPSKRFLIVACFAIGVMIIIGIVIPTTFIPDDVNQYGKASVQVVTAIGAAILFAFSVFLYRVMREADIEQEQDKILNSLEWKDAEPIVIDGITVGYTCSLCKGYILPDKESLFYHFTVTHNLSDKVTKDAVPENYFKNSAKR